MMAQGRAAAGLLFVAGLALVQAAPARAEVRVAGEAGYFAMTGASKSAKAVFGGGSGGPTYGGSFSYGLGQHFFVQATGRLFKKTGERVFVADATSPVFRLGHPLTIRLGSAYGLVGYRLRPDASLSPYIGVGAGATSYKETSNVAGVVDTFSTTKPSGHAILGLDFGRGPIRFGAEAAYSTVPSVIGLGGVSKVYGESNVGGFAIVGRIVFVH